MTENFPDIGRGKNRDIADASAGARIPASLSCSIAVFTTTYCPFFSSGIFGYAENGDFRIPTQTDRVVAESGRGWLSTLILKNRLSNVDSRTE